MRFWWVNQNQTFDQEFRGGYLWSPKRNRSSIPGQKGARNQYYENMREVAPGDVIFSFVDQRIAAIGVARSYGQDAPKPLEFGSKGAYWDRIGWRVEVAFRRPDNRIRPRDHIGILRPLLPKKYSPLQESGYGIQSVYLAELSRPFAETLAGLIGIEAQELLAGAGENPLSPDPAPAHGIDEWEEHIHEELVKAPIPDTERTALIRARVGQGVFKQNVLRVEHACRLTKVDNLEHLVGSHIKPWRDSSNDERLDGENGLLLTPTVDHLFDRGFISFNSTGELLISPVADIVSLRRMGVPVGTPINVGEFSRRQEQYLEYHRDAVFLKASSADA